MSSVKIAEVVEIYCLVTAAEGDAAKTGIIGQ